MVELIAMLARPMHADNRPQVAQALVITDERSEQLPKLVQNRSALVSLSRIAMNENIHSAAGFSA